MSTHHKKLGQFFATAISGNDILSSSLYVSGIAILFAGVYAPLVLLCIAGVLYLYKTVYTEVVEALPVNGGAYNCLLNGTQKIVAGIAGITTFLSYITTAVISAKVALEYLHTLIPVPVMAGTILLLFFFCAFGNCRD
jgi:amino acid transporter